MSKIKNRAARRKSRQKGQYISTHQYVNIDRNYGSVYNTASRMTVNENVNEIHQPGSFNVKVEGTRKDEEFKTSSFVEDPIVNETPYDEAVVEIQTEQTSSKKWLWGVAIAAAAVGIGILTIKSK